MVGKRGSKEAVVLSLLEKKTENYIAIRIPGKDADSVLNAMQSLREGFGEKFSQVLIYFSFYFPWQSKPLGCCSLI